MDQLENFRSSERTEGRKGGRGRKSSSLVKGKKKQPSTTHPPKDPNQQTNKPKKSKLPWDKLHSSWCYRHLLPGLLKSMPLWRLPQQASSKQTGRGLSVESFPQKYFLFFFPPKTCLLATSTRNDQVSAQNRLNGNITTIFILISIENLVEANRDLRK